MLEGWLTVATRKEKLAVEWSQCEDMADFLTKLMTIREELLAHATAADQRIAELEKALLDCMSQIEAFDRGGCSPHLPGGGRLALARAALGGGATVAHEALATAPATVAEASSEGAK